MRRPTPLRTVAVGALIALGGVAGCGDTTSDEPAAAATGCTAGDGATVTVAIPEFRFEPEPVRIGVCDSVVWDNAHDQPHTSTGRGDQAWSTGNLAPGSVSEPVRFEAAGSFTYICALHPFMEGTVEVS